MVKNLIQDSILSKNNDFKDTDSQPVSLTEDDYKTIIENSAEAITVTDQSERLVLCNKMAETLLGMKPHELYLKPVSQIYPEEEWKRIRSEHIRQKGINHHMETKIIGAAGQLLDIDLSLSVLKGTDGSIHGSIGIMRDISERKNTERALKESVELSRGMIETAATAIFLLKDERFTFVNRILEEMTGYSTDELLSMSHLDLVFPEFLVKYKENYKKVVVGKPAEPQIFRILRKDLETTWVSEKLTSINYAGINHIMGNWMDITEWKISESIAIDHLNQTDILLEIGNTVSKTLDLQEIAENIIDILNRKLHNGPIAFFSIPIQNDSFTLLSQKGFSEDFVKRMGQVILGKGLVGRTITTGKSFILNSNSEDPRFDFKVLQKDDLWSFCVIPVFAREKVNGVICMGSHNKQNSLARQTQLLELVANQIGVAIDNAQLYQKTSEIAFTDGLTGLYNRRYFEEELNRELSRSLRNKHPFSIVSMDLDNLKTTNDTYGHQTGDLLIKNFSSILLKNLRKSDIAARVGGDEFMVLITDATLDSTSTIAQRIWSQVGITHIEVDNSIIDLSASGGVATFPIHGKTVELLVKHADEAMYKAKHTGKNKVIIT